jgi:hypothetical protein
MTEINGLRVIVDDAVKGGTIHAIEPPPQRREFVYQCDYEKAYDDWYRRMNIWTVTNIGEP